MNIARTSAALVAMGVLVTACGSGSGGSGAPDGDAAAAVAEPAATAAPEAPAAEPADVVPAALRFTAPLVGGGELDASTLAGTTTVFWFWAPT